MTLCMCTGKANLAYDAATAKMRARNVTRNERLESEVYCVDYALGSL